MVWIWKMPHWPMHLNTQPQIITVLGNRTFRGMKHVFCKWTTGGGLLRIILWTHFFPEHSLLWDTPRCENASPQVLLFKDRAPIATVLSLTWWIRSCESWVKINTISPRLLNIRYFITLKKKSKLGVVVSTFNSSTWVVEAGGSVRVQG